MVHRRSTPWIYRWSRKIMGAIAILGALLTAYLTYEKLRGQEVACGLESAVGCNDVLSSPYAEIFGIPLTIFGLLAYVTVAVLALAPLVLKQQTTKPGETPLERTTWTLLILVSTAMATFSGYLMFILFAKIGGFCLYCITSALFSLSFFGLTIAGRLWEDLGQLIFNVLVVSVVTLVAMVGIYAPVERQMQAAIPDESGRITIPANTKSPQPPKGWEITTESGPAEISLAEHLTAIGARKFGAYWCPHCYDQKQLFGKKAFEKVTYVECDPQGINPQPEVCSAAQIQGYPSWEINGEIYTGTKTLEQLSQISGYEGPQDFRYKLPGR